MRRRVLGMVLAGGQGSRLRPLTDYRSKPGVPFGGVFRIVDFVLSNLVNSEIKSIYVLTQFKSQSLVEHLHRSWAGTNLRPGNFIIPVPAQMQTGGQVWYEGTADAIGQNLNLIRETRPDLVCIFGGDHIYYMNVRRMLQAHVRSEADVSIAAIPVPAAEATSLGVLETDDDKRVRAFHEKVATPPRMPSDPERCYASMGNYVFSRDVLERVLEADAADPNSSHDFGHDILPKMVAAGDRVFAYNFESNKLPGRSRSAKNTYWRDVGTLDAFYDANMDLKEAVPQLNLYNREWPVHGGQSSSPPGKFIHGADGTDAIVARCVMGTGTIISGATAKDSILGRNVRIEEGSQVEASVIMDGVKVGRGCKIRKAIIDKDVRLAARSTVGHDPDADRDRGWTVTDSGITVIPKQPVVRPVTVIDL